MIPSILAVVLAFQSPPPPPNEVCWHTWVRNCAGTLKLVPSDELDEMLADSGWDFCDRTWFVLYDCVIMEWFSIATVDGDWLPPVPVPCDVKLKPCVVLAFIPNPDQQVFSCNPCFDPNS